jgi:hypothetical protein
MARIVTQRKIDQFKQYAWDLWKCNFNRNDGIRIHVNEEIGTRHLCIMLEVGENTTARQLHKAVPLAIQWRDRLNEFQGCTDNGDLFLQSMQQLFESGKTYAKIADIANARIADLLREWHELAGKNYIRAWQFEYDIRVILNALNAGQVDVSTGKSGRRSKNNELKRQKLIDTIIDDGLKQIAEGKEPFDAPQSPISKFNVEYSIKQWRK